VTPRVSGTLLALTSATAFGVMPVLTKVVYADGAELVGVLAVRFAIAAALLLALARLRGERLPGRRGVTALALLGGVGYVSQSLLYFSALERISAGLTALLLYAHPAMVVLLSALLLGARPRPVALACVVVAGVGTALTVGPVGGGQVSGVLLGLGAALAYAFYIVLSSRALAGGSADATGPLATSAVVLCAAAVVYGTLALLTRPQLPGTAAAWAALLGVALVGTVVAVTAFFAALARLGPSDTAVVSTAEPVVSVAVAAVALGERLGALQVAGGVLVLAAVVVLARQSQPEPVSAPAPASARPARPGRSRRRRDGGSASP
jgi:drug/metabolite transporter (DMT)-like permease